MLNRSGIFQTNTQNRSVPKIIEKIFCFITFPQPFPILHATVRIKEKRRAAARQVCARGMRNHKMPTSNIMPFPVHSKERIRTSNKTSIVQNMSIRKTTGRLLQITAKSIMPQFQKSLANSLRFFTGNKDIHS